MVTRRKRKKSTSTSTSKRKRTRARSKVLKMATVNQSILRKVVRAYKELSKMEDLFKLEMVEDKVDEWQVTFLFPQNKVVILKCQFYLAEYLPPKATVVFPTSISWVCFEGLHTSALPLCYLPRAHALLGTIHR